MMEETADLHEYWGIIKRRKYHIIVPAVAVFVLAVVIAFLLPPVYKSSATILIEAQEIPQELVRTTVTGYVEERLQTITQIVLSRSKLLEIINRFGLYADLKSRYTAEEIIEKMREDIQMEPIQAEVVNPQSGRPGSATIAFTLSFEADDPGKAAQVANVITSLYLEENLRNREEKARTTFEFLEGQLSALRADIVATEAKIAEFKNRHIQVLPELMQVNLQTMDRLQRDIAAKEEQIKALANRKIYLEGQLATVEPIMYSVSLDGRRVMTPKEELETLRSEYLRLKATLSAEHPDVIALKKRLDAMEGEVTTRDQLRDRTAQLRDKETQLALLEKRLSGKHPDVVMMRKEVAELRADVEELSKKQVMPKAEDQKPENPSYINLQTQIASADLEIGNARKDLEQLKAAFADYQKRVEMTPQVEQQYRALERDYANAQATYQETMGRLMSAREAKGLEESRMGEKFTLVDPPITPELPDRPNRVAIVLIGFVLAMGAGIGFGSLSEYMDQSVRRADELAAVAGHPVLAVIPFLETPEDRAGRVRKRLAVVVVGVALVAVGLAAVHFLYRPLDILWIRILRELSIGF
jgi:succinoglycan biosynthesis transport protein ExoP